jgi:hypothetical protein
VRRDLLAVHPGVVGGEVQAPELPDRPLDQPPHVAGLAHVGRLEDGPAPGVPGARCDRLPLAASRLPMAGAAPALASAKAVALPIPDPPPVSTATLPSSRSETAASSGGFSVTAIFPCT